jgi:RND family efflux transporter MFP subunit
MHRLEIAGNHFMSRAENKGIAGECLLSLVAVCALAAGCQKPTEVNAGEAVQAMPVHVLVVKSQTVPESTEYLAVLKSRHSANINPQVEGYITKIFVKSGDRVEAGAQLLQIDPLKQQATVSSQQAAVRAQQATVQFAQVQLDREKRLFESGVVARQELDNAQTNYDAAVAQLKSLEEQVNQQQVELKYYAVSAPMSGIVGDIPVRVGDRVAVTTLLTTVDEPGALEAYVYVPAERARDLRMGLPVHLVDSAGKSVAATRLTFISPQVDTGTQTVLAKATVENTAGKLRVEQQVRAQVTWSEHPGVLVPVLAVSRINGRFFAFVAVNDGKSVVARQRALRLGDTVGNDFIVDDGIRPGDHLISSGLQFLQDGMPVSEIVDQARRDDGQGNGMASP